MGSPGEGSRPVALGPLCLPTHMLPACPRPELGDGGLVSLRGTEPVLAAMCPRCRSSVCSHQEPCIGISQTGQGGRRGDWLQRHRRVCVYVPMSVGEVCTHLHVSVHAHVCIQVGVRTPCDIHSVPTLEAGTSRHLSHFRKCIAIKKENS